MRLYKISTFFWHLKKRKKDLSAEDLRPVEAAILFCLPLGQKRCARRQAGNSEKRDHC